MNKRSLTALLVIVTVILVDQAVKFAVKTGMTLHEHIAVTSWFQIFFTENQGMAFGMDFFGTNVLTLFRVVAIAFFVYYLARLLRRPTSMAVIVCFALVIAGALGNVIDNCLYGLIFTSSPEAYLFEPPAHIVPFGQGYGTFLTGRVVDMFYFPLWRWPDWVPLLGGQMFFNAVFNVADAAITCGAIALLAIYYRNSLRQARAERKARPAAAN